VRAAYSGDVPSTLGIRVYYTPYAHVPAEAFGLETALRRTVRASELKVILQL